MFEKSLYDLIRGMRNHKGKEKEYIQNCLKECRAEIRGQDMDLKATALLKLVYLEMFGNDMSWASFHVLEVMSSPKYHQKRIGYLGAVQTFRADTEVLMLATNLLKKDLVASSTTTIGLPIVTLPHVITPSLALSVLPDLLPRLSHTHPNVRKKTIVTLYRMALVYPETLRAAWPKIKERLMDKSEDSSVTAAIVNVVCELGWRRPRDFLPLAPRLFELLVDSGNNWMAIKLIKLFATLTPLEPRLVRKLLPPLTEIIRTTPAMSLLYECINGIIQGGILGDGDSADGQEEIAQLCVSKLRSMIMVDGDANLKYVALLAFNKIVVTHPWLVAQQEDVILECIDSTDISIRVNALDLVQGMVNSDNLVSIVSRLMRQLKSSSADQNDGPRIANMDGYDEDDDDSRSTPRRSEKTQDPPIPNEYKFDVINRILAMCSQNNYSNLTDFEWYIDVLTQLVRMVPNSQDPFSQSTSGRPAQNDVSEKVGNELRTIAVKVQAVRSACVQAAESTVLLLARDASSGLANVPGALAAIAWILGEFSTELSSPDDTLGQLLQLMSKAQAPETVASCIQATMKIFSLITGDESSLWTPERKSKTLLLMARVVDAFEKLALHPNLEVQERAVEFTELLKLTTEAATSQEVSSETVAQDAPLLLTQAIPSLFTGWTLHSVAMGAQKNVPPLDGLDLDEPINPNLSRLLASADNSDVGTEDADEFDAYYHQKPAPTSIMSEPAINRLADKNEESISSYQQPTEDMYLDPDIVARRKAERMDKNRDDPFYIGAGADTQRSSTPIHNILQNSNGPDLDVDSIPIMKLDLDNIGGAGGGTTNNKRPTKPRIRQKIEIAADENLASSGVNTPRSFDSDGNNVEANARARARNRKLLGVDSANIGSLSLEGDPSGVAGPGSTLHLDPEAQQREEAEMAKAMKEVERLRLEMQRANERIHVAQGVDAEGVVVKKKKKTTTTTTSAKKSSASSTPVSSQQQQQQQADGNDEAAGVVKPKKKKKKVAAQPANSAADAEAEEAGTSSAAKPKKKKKKVARTVDMQGGGEE
ncbi:adaptin N terminal region-domain-containing protein [Microdochium trichocladiopsis]|uniref:AP-3 complex subunit delta n=1 Tax=Microdochium trichocladiopsis TaxID=1682393 RepID=A0A9P8YBT7_9PEZI|nr:adaptin N terminal region-domain-containing protein [Microdochium trichocladiopsis]KAH7033307.1 adaptin N terminal region-domain-containing protein [Microdochium trichocladiopsis]